MGRTPNRKPEVALRGLSVRQKLALIALPVLVPVAFLLYYSYSANAATINIAQSEKRGMEYCRALRKVLEHLQTHSGLSASKNNDFSFRPLLAEQQVLIDAAIKEVDAADAKHGAEFKSTEAWTKFKTEWTQLRNQALGLNATETASRHEKLIDDLNTLSIGVAEISTLVLDPDVDSYWLQLIMFDRTLELTNRLGASRGRAAIVSGKKVLSSDDLLRIEINQAQAKASGELVGRNLNSVFAYNAELKPKLEPAYNEFTANYGKAEAYLAEKILKPDAAAKATPRETFDAASKPFASAYALYDACDPILESLLDQRIAATRRSMYLSFGFVGLSLILVAIIAITVARGIARQVVVIRSVFDEVAKGNFTARAERQSSDDLGAMAVGLNKMMDDTLGLMQTRNERDQIQVSIMKLLDEVSGVADGDLTKEAEVTSDMTGAIADSFNYMISQLRDIIGHVKSATLQVSTAAGQIQSTAEHLADGSEEQAAAIVTTSVAVEEMAQSIQQVSANAVRSAAVAESAKASAKQGSEAVNNTILGMNRIRDQVQETAKRIKRLGESTQQIGDIVQLIDDIAERTSLLALNASIQAAMAGEAGRGFAVVAQEVERLAERSTSATKKIAVLVKTIQVETTEAITAMEEGTREVVEGSKLAVSAGQALGRIEDVSAQLDELIKSISAAAKQQARASEGVAASMSQISEVTQQTAAGTKQAAVSVNQLAEMADELRGSVSRFRLPNEIAPVGGKYPLGV